MGTFKKESWKGKEAFENIMMFSFLIIAFLSTFLGRLVSDNFSVGIYVFIGIIFYFMILAYISKSFAHKITKQFAGVRRWRCRYDLGRGRTGNITLYIEDHYPLEEAPISLQQKVAKTEAIMGDVEIEVEAIEKEKIKVSALSIVEESRTKKEQAIKELQEREIEEKTYEEYILDKLLQPYYEKETKKDAFVKGKPSKEFTEWKNSDGKVEKILQITIKNQIAELEKNKKQTKKDITERRLELIGEEIAIGYPLSEIISADKGEAEGGAVHGFLKAHYEDYEDLITKHQILDIAQRIAKEIWIPKITKAIEHVHLADCVKTVVPLFEEAFFDHEPNFIFKTMVVFAQEPFIDAVDWKEKVPKTIHYYPDIPVTNGYSNIIVPTSITHDCPMIFIAHAPGKDYFIKNLRFDPKEIKSEEINAMKIEIANLKVKKNELVEKAMDLEKEARSERERKIQYKDAYEMAMKTYLKKHINQYDPRGSLEKVNLGKALLYVIAIIGIIFLIVVLINLGGGMSSNITNSTSLLESSSTYLQCFNLMGWG